MHFNDEPPVLAPSPSGRGVGGAVFIILFAFLAIMACFKYLALHSTVSEFGTVLSDIYSVHHAGQWWRAFLGQARPLLPLYAQIYRLVPEQAAPLALLILQALTLALPALWAGKRYGMLAALAYALYFPVWTLALSDFHFDHLLLPVLFGFLAAATSGRFKTAFVLGLLPALVKGPFAWTTVCCGLYLWLVAGRSRGGLALILGGSLYSYVASHWLVPFCTAEGAFAATVDGPGAVLAALVAHPATTLADVLTVPGKWRLFGVSFAALLFFPLFRPKLLLPAVPALVMGLLSMRPETCAWTGQATAGMAGVLFFAFCEVLGPVRILAGQSGHGARHVSLVLVLAMGMGHLLLAPSPVSRLFLTTNNFAFSAAAYEPTARDAAILAEIIKSVPADPDVPVVSQNTLNWGALAERVAFDTFPVGVFDPHPYRDLSQATLKDFWIFLRTGQTPNLPTRTWQARYVLLDLTRPWYVADRGCGFVQGACQDTAVGEEFQALVERARKDFETVTDQGGFLILRRPQPKPAVKPAAPTPTAPPAAGQEPATAPQPSAATPTPQATTAAQPTAPAANAPTPATVPATPNDADQSQSPASQIQVEILDRFPPQHHGKKTKAAAPGEPQAAGQPAPETVAPAPEGAPADATQPQQTTSRRRRHKTTAPAPETTAPTPEAAAQPSEAAPADSATPAQRKPSRRHRTPAPETVTPAPGAPTPDALAPAPESPPADAGQPQKTSRHRRRRATPTPPATATPQPAEAAPAATP